MLDVLFNDLVTVRRLAGPRDGHGKPTLKVMVEVDTEGKETDVPLYVDCFIDRTRRVQRTVSQTNRNVDATLLYNVSLSPVRLREDDLISLDSTDETYRVGEIVEQISAVEGSEYARLTLVRTKAPITPNAQRESET